jgi:hypothetical protein
MDRSQEPQTVPAGLPAVLCSGPSAPYNWVSSGKEQLGCDALASSLSIAGNGRPCSKRKLERRQKSKSAPADLLSLAGQRVFSIGDYSRSLTCFPKPPPPVTRRKMKYWEIIADRLSNAGWAWGYTSLIDSAGQMLFNVDAHRNDGRRYIVRADEPLAAFLELQATLLL